MKRFIAKLPPATLTITVLIVILYLTLTPEPLPHTHIHLFPGADKVVHAIMFGGLTGAMALDCSRRSSVSTLTLGVLATMVIISTVTGGCIELAQDYMGMGRGCELWDFIADGIGAIAGALMSRPVARLVCEKK